MYSGEFFPNQLPDPKVFANAPDWSKAQAIALHRLRRLREKLVQEVRRKGMKDEKVLEALMRVPRHGFVESAFTEAAYEDRPLPIGDGQTISQPTTVAWQSHMLQVKKGAKVLEIGTGSGYQAAVLCELGAKVFSVERIRVHHQKASVVLGDLGYKVRLKWGDGSAGWQMYAPFDRILVTAASPSIPEALKTQLAMGGKLVIPVGGRESQEMMIVTRLSEKEFELEKRGRFAFVPMIGKYGWKD
ncbi:MAG: protein-L-isoaspartate(D-aspartate) O-methyltransferase [Bacteroidota bacterium]